MNSFKINSLLICFFVTASSSLSNDKTTLSPELFLKPVFSWETMPTELFDSEKKFRNQFVNPRPALYFSEEHSSAPGITAYGLQQDFGNGVICSRVFQFYRDRLLALHLQCILPERFEKQISAILPQMQIVGIERKVKSDVNTAFARSKIKTIQAQYTSRAIKDFMDNDMAYQTQRKHELQDLEKKIEYDD